MYLLVRIWALAPKFSIKHSELIEHFVAPLFSDTSNDCNELAYKINLLNSDVDFKESFKEIFLDYSQLKVKVGEYPIHSLTIENYFIRMRTEFFGTDENLKLFLYRMRNLIQQRCFELFNIKTPVAAYAKFGSKDVQFIDFYFALDERGVEDLIAFKKREKSVEIANLTQDGAITDTALEREFMKHDV